MPKRARWMISLVMVFAMLLSTAGTAFAAESVDSGSQLAMTSRASIPTYEQVYTTLIGLKDQYYEGLLWTNFTPYSLPFNPYRWRGGKVTEQSIAGGVGCAALAFIFSDKAFGDLPARALNEGQFTYDDVKVGDILRFKNDGSEHSVIVLTKSANGITVAEGNYNKSVHWGRAFSKEHVMSRTLYLITRYPAGYSEEPNPDADKPAVGANGEEAKGSVGSLTWVLTQSHVLTISGTGAIPDYSPDNLPPWYAYKDQIYTIEITGGITTIGDYAFYQTKNAYDVYIPDGVKSIGQSAFRESGIMTAAIPSSAATIGADAFHGCTGLIAATIPDGVKVLGERAFMSCMGLQYIDFPASITSLGAGAFAESTDIVRVRFAPGGGKVIMGDNLFSRCWKLTSVVLPSGADCISAGMFTACTSLTNLDIPASITVIRGFSTPSGAPFAGCTALTTINFGGSQEQWNEADGPANITYSGLGKQVTVNFGVTFENPFAPIPGDLNSDLITDATEENPPAGPAHEHKWAEAWSHNYAHHWHECEAEDCPITSNGEKGGYARHSYIGTTCACGYTHECEWAEGWTYDRTHHWHRCIVAGCPIASNDEKLGFAEHIYEELITNTEEIVEMMAALAADTDGSDLALSEEEFSPDAKEDVLDSGEKSAAEEGGKLLEGGEEDSGEHEPDADTEDENASGAGPGEDENSGVNTGAGTLTDPEPGTELGPNPEAEPQPETEPKVTASTICSICGYNSTQPLPDPPACQHIWSEAWSHDAANHWHQCDDCTESTDNAAHSYGGWVISAAATATQSGSKHRVCTVCKFRQTKDIPATGNSTSANPNGPSHPSYPSNPGTSSNAASPTTTTTTRNPDGSITTTITNKNTKTTTETTKNPDGSQTVAETRKDGTVILEVKLSAAAIDAAQRRGKAVSLPIPAMHAVRTAENAPSITVSTGNDKPIRVIIPTINSTPGTVAVVVHPNGLTEVVKASVPASDGIVIPVSDGATVKVIDNSKSFTDVPAGNWAENAITFVAARELFAGTSATTFAPEQPMTRAMLMTVLARFDGVETSDGATWYPQGMEWAVAHGISDGASPSSNITREQLVTMLWRYMGSPATVGTLSEFTDAGQTSGYAKEAMRWAVENGLISGFGNRRLDPQGQATRAQVAQIIQNLIKNMILCRQD